MPRILIIDDEKSIRRTLREILEYENFKVEEAADGQEGLQFAQKEKFDIILCRNVLIYFNQFLQNEGLNLFSNCLFSGGYVAIGAKESISWCEVAFKFTPVNLEEKIYKKIKD